VPDWNGEGSESRKREERAGVLTRVGAGTEERKETNRDGERRREKRSCRALKSPKRRAALGKSNTNERRKEQTNQVKQGIV